MSTAGIVTAEIFEPSPKEPILVCGMPGSGFVGKLAVDHLIEAFRGRKFAEAYSADFPPNANVGEDGIVKQIRGEFYLCETGQRADLLVFTADAQPATTDGEYELSRWVLDCAKKHGVKLVFSLAAYITGTFTAEQRVFGAATSRELAARMNEDGVKLMKEGAISGMNGIVTGMAKLYGMEGACLLGETSGYLVDPAASEVVLDLLSRALKLKIDLASLRDKAREVKQVMGQIQRMTEQESGPRQNQTGQPGYIG
ncbi:MAG: proteasome assembly chaperone family protein [Nitrososphaerota archaeon]|nr:proteasome assembly chaperone family protein [Nitrososphaerota archaeon]